MISDHKNSKLITFGPYDIIMESLTISFHIQVFDNRTSTVYIRDLNNDEIIEITQNLCNSQQELYSLLLAGFTNKTKNSEVKISEKGVICYICTINFPIDRVFKFELELYEQDLTELQKLDFQIKKLGAKMTGLQELMTDKSKSIFKDEGYMGAFSLILNSGYYSFSNQNKTITRKNNDNKTYKTVWGSKPFEKKSAQQSFSVKIERIAQDLDCLYAFIGIGYSLHHGLNIYNYKGAYCITNGKASIDGKEVLMNDFLFVGDIIKVMIDFENKEAKWYRNNMKIFNISLRVEEINAYEVYPIISLSCFNDTVSFI